MRRWGLPLLAVAGVLGLGLMIAPGDAEAAACVPGQWKDDDAPRRIRQLAAPIERETGWTGLGDFLVAVAYWETRGNSAAVGDDRRAYGWFQMHKGARCLDALGVSVEELIGNEPLAVAVAACHAHVLATLYYKRDLRSITWQRIRNGWASPGYVNQNVPRLRSRFRRALCAVELPPRFADRRAFPPGFAWPGAEAVLAMTRGAA